MSNNTSKHTACALLFFFALLLMNVGCRGNKMPVLSFEVKTSIPHDSTLVLMLLGRDVIQTDSIRPGLIGKTYSIRPDTNHIRQAVFVTNGGTKLEGYQLIGGVWRPTPTESLVGFPYVFSGAEAPAFSGEDVSENYISLSNLYYEHPVALIFTDTTALTAADSAQLRKSMDAIPSDSVTCVYLIMTPSGQEALHRVGNRKDHAIVISDSLGLVSRVRADYGITSSHALCIVDSLGRIVVHSQNNHLTPRK